MNICSHLTLIRNVNKGSELTRASGALVAFN